MTSWCKHNVQCDLWRHGNLNSHMCETRKFLMAILHRKQGLLCDKKCYLTMKSWQILRITQYQSMAACWIWSPRIEEDQCQRIHSRLIGDHCYNDVEWQPAQSAIHGLKRIIAKGFIPLSMVIIFTLMLSWKAASGLERTIGEVLVRETPRICKCFQFRQIESSCRWQDKCDWKTEICFWNDRKRGKRRKCWLPAFSPFPTIF